MDCMKGSTADYVGFQETLSKRLQKNKTAYPQITPITQIIIKV